jgi:hypothetical protein
MFIYIDIIPYIAGDDPFGRTLQDAKLASRVRERASKLRKG